MATEVRLARAAVVGEAGSQPLIRLAEAALLADTPAARVKIMDAQVLAFSPTAGSGAVRLAAASVLSGVYDPSVQGVVRVARAAVVGVSVGSGQVRLARAAVVTESLVASNRRLFVLVAGVPTQARYGLVEGGAPSYL